MTGKFFEIAFTPEVQAAQTEQYGRAVVPPRDLPEQPLGPVERQFIAARDSFYMATVGSGGWPYVQHRGGAPGFLAVLDEHRLAFADLTGNRQLVSRGNLAGDDRVALILMDYPGRRRLKILGRAEIGPPDDELAAALAPAGGLARVERVLVIRVLAFDWNCPKYVTPRYSAAEVEAHTRALRERIAELEAEVERLRREPESHRPSSATADGDGGSAHDHR